MEQKLRLENRQALKQMHLLMMLPKMKQAFALLAAPLLELSQMIELEITQNPLLESIETTEEESEPEIEPFTLFKDLDWDNTDYYKEVSDVATPAALHNFQESLITQKTTFYSYLVEQINEHFQDPLLQQAAKILAASVDDHGFLTTPFEELLLLTKLGEKTLQPLIQTLQTFDPPGVFASSLQHSLLIQLKDKPIAYQIIKDYFEDLLHNHLIKIQKALHLSKNKLLKVIEGDILTLNFNPKSYFLDDPTQIIIPDVSLQLEDGELTVEVHHETLPKLHLKKHYLDLLEDPHQNSETKHFLKKALESAKWLFKSLEQRENTLKRVVEYIAKKQKIYLTTQEGQLQPLILKEVAEALEVHESTVARAISSKWVQTPKGLLPLKAFFTNSFTTTEGKNISSSTVKEAVTKLIAQEEKKKPLSDEQIAQALKKLGIPCARRTIAKYRQQLGLGTKNQRKRLL